MFRSSQAHLRWVELEARVVPAQLGIIADEAHQLEGNAGTAPLTFAVVRSGDISTSASVDFAISGSVDAADFGGTLPSGTVSFAANETRKLITLNAVGDNTDEPNERFTVTLSNVVGDTLTTATAEGLIVDDDGVVLTVTSAADSGAGSLRNTIASAPSGARIGFNLPANTTITLTSGAINLPANSNLLIDGTTASNLTLDGNKAARIFTLNSTSVQPTSLVVRGLTLANGNAGSSNGGAIGTVGELHTLLVEGVTFAGNEAAEGGAIHSVFRGTLTLDNCVFQNNQAISANSEQGAGAVFFLGPNSLTVRDSTFEANRGINGGAINNLAGRVSIDNSVFRNNDVLAARFATGKSNDFLRGYGGALYSDRVSPAGDAVGGTYRIRNSIFENNQGRAAGGALYLYTGEQDSLAIVGSSFQTNSTIGLINAAGNPQGEAGNGGAIELQSDAPNRGLMIASSTFAHNRSVDRGGAVRLRNFPGTFVNNTFDDNRTTLAGTANFTGGLGGAIEMSGGKGIAVSAVNNTFTNNFATWTGGAILAAVSLRADNNLFAGNTTDTFANGNPILSHIDGSNLSGSNNLQAESNRGQANNEAIPGGTTTGNPLLAALANNGGANLTRALQTGSAAINAGNNAAIPTDAFDLDSDGDTLEPVPFDQRGVGFPRLLEGTIDIGAFESGTVPAVPTLAISALAASANEGNTGVTAFTFTVTRSGPTGAASSATFAVTGTGANPANATDFGGNLPNGTVTFGVGETSQTITINVSGDGTVEANEGFTVTLSNPSNAVLTTTTATGTILNDDTPPVPPVTPSLAISATTPNQNEGNTGVTAFTFTVTRTGDTSAASSATFTVNGSGANPADAIDFGGNLPAGTVNFGVGVTSQTITINVSGDVLVESAEGFGVTLSNPTNATLTTASATATIFNDDSVAGNTAPTLADPGPQTVAELATLTFTLVGNDADVGDSLTYSLVNGPVGLIVNPTTGVVTWTPTETQDGNATVTVRVADTVGAIAERTFTVAVSEVNSAPTLTDPGSQSVVASGTLTVALTASDPDAPANTLTFALLNPLTGASINASTGVVTFVAGTTSGTVPLTVEVRDNGTPALSTSVTFNVSVTAPLSPPIFTERYAIGAGVGGSNLVTVYEPTGSVAYTVAAFPTAPPGGVRVATGDVNGDGVADLIVGTGPGVVAQVRVLDGVTQQELFSLQPFDQFTGGVFVAVGDLTGDGRADFVISPDEGGGPRVRLFSGAGFTQINDFFGIEDTEFRGGARVAVADVTGDGVGDLLVAAGFGGGPRLAVFDGVSLGNATPSKPFGDFFVFEPGLRNGVFVTGGDLDGDGFAEVIAGAGPGGGPRIFALSGKDLLAGQQVQRANFFAGNVDNRGGIRVASKELDGDSRADLIVTNGTDAAPLVAAYAGASILADGTPPVLQQDTPFDATFTGGIFVG